MTYKKDTPVIITNVPETAAELGVQFGMPAVICEDQRDGDELVQIKIGHAKFWWSVNDLSPQVECKSIDRDQPSMLGAQLEGRSFHVSLRGTTYQELRGPQAIIYEIDKTELDEPWLACYGPRAKSAPEPFAIPWPPKKPADATVDQELRTPIAWRLSEREWCYGTTDPGERDWEPIYYFDEIPQPVMRFSATDLVLAALFGAFIRILFYQFMSAPWL